MHQQLGDLLAAKLRERISVRDFGALGDGSSDDTAAIQRAIDEVAALGDGGELFFPLGRYVISDTLRVRRPLHLRGTGFGDVTGSNTNLMQDPGTAIVWKHNAARRTMLRFASGQPNQTLHGGSIRGIFFDASNRARTCIRVSSARETEIEVATFRPTDRAILLDDANGRLLDSVRIVRLVARIGGNPAVARAAGIHIRGSFSNGGAGCTNVWMGDIDVEYHQGDGVIFEEVDSCVILRMKGSERLLASSPGRAVVFRDGGGAFPAQKNVVVHLARGKVMVEPQCIGNRILYWNSEGGRTFLHGGASNLSYAVTDRVHGDTFQGGTLYPMKVNLDVSPGSLQQRGGAVDAAIGPVGWGGVELPAGVPSEVCFSVPPPDSFNNGRILGVRIFSFSSVSAARNFVRLTLQMTAIRAGQGAHAVERTVTERLRIGRDNAVLTTLELRFPNGQHLNYRRGEWLGGILRREGAHAADNSPQGLILGGLQVIYECSGPDSAGGGPWQVPKDQMD